ncbi:MAG: class I SAM-dependent methyltransferase [Caldilineae bacterium]|nr:class I SAM-dependent methyltransferase [Caldilineae bacterium]
MQQDTDNVTNLFVHSSAAKRYASARPFFHPLIAARIAAFTGIARFARALDVACGTGQSSRALTEIADHVDAVDVSPEMIAEAEPHERVSYHTGRAEAVPFPDRTFDLVTVGLAFHWFDQADFLREAHRVLQTGCVAGDLQQRFHRRYVRGPGFSGLVARRLSRQVSNAAAAFLHRDAGGRRAVGVCRARQRELCSRREDAGGAASQLSSDPNQRHRGGGGGRCLSGRGRQLDTRWSCSVLRWPSTDDEISRFCVLPPTGARCDQYCLTIKPGIDYSARC